MSEKKIMVIACGVLEWDLRQLIAGMKPDEIVVRYMPAQLHNNPRRLRDLLQNAINEIEREAASFRGICLAYGVCGRGVIGLQSRTLPLVLPRVQDCIGLCLGSHRRYSEQFRHQPGTRYMTRGWYESNSDENSAAADQCMSARNQSLYGPTEQQLRNKYGAGNAAFISRFRESWKHNYRRAAYIFSPAETDYHGSPARLVTQAAADELGWEFVDIAGDYSLLKGMLEGNWHQPGLLVVPPHSKIAQAPGDEVLAFTSQFDPAAIIGHYNRRPDESMTIERHGIGLGIDTGGTFTDAVLFDFSSDAVVAAAKSPTTHENLVVGIEKVLEQLPSEILRRTERVGLSTTLATNAFVERKGRKVALLLMSPVEIAYDELDFQVIEHVDGAMTIDGRESQPINREQIIQVALAARDRGCEAFAISGFAGVVNPSHELEVARVTCEATGLHAVCGHQLSSELNFMQRATTAAMNAKLIPLVENLLAAVRKALDELGLKDVLLMVVKGDGSQMLDQVAREFPVETVMSGPAASVVGAARVSGLKNAVIADIGGTTLDVARLHDGQPVVSETGARIVDFQTSVRAVAMHTTGLGGDSEIDLHQWPRIRIGPRRIVPICRFTADYPEKIGELDAVMANQFALEPHALEFVALTSDDQADQAPLLKELASGPCLLSRLAERMNRPGCNYIKWQQYEATGQLRRYGLTLTDVLHQQNQYLAFQRDASVRLLRTWADILAVDIEDLVDGIMREFRKRVGIELISALAPAHCPWKEKTGNEFIDWLAETLAKPSAHRDPDFNFTFASRIPVIPVGAPASALFPAIEETIGVRVKIPSYAEVTNAIGAIAGNVLLKETAVIRFGEDNAVVCSWRGGMKRTGDLQTALHIGEENLRKRIQAEAAVNRVPFVEPKFTASAKEAMTADGKVLLGVNLTAEIEG